MTDRGTGRTTKQIMSPPDGAIFVVSNTSVKSHVRHLLRLNGRHPECLKVLTLDNFDKIQPRRGTVIDVDHDAQDRMNTRQLAMFAVMHAHR